MTTREGKSIDLGEHARCLMHAGNLEASWQATEDGIEEVGESRKDRTYWSLRFVRAETLRLRGLAKEALTYLDELNSSPPNDTKSLTELTMHRGYCSAVLGRYGTACALLQTAHAVALTSDFRELQGEIIVRQAMLAYLQRDYYNSESLYNSVFKTHGEEFGWHLYCVSRGGVGKCLMARRKYDEALPWLEGAVLTAETVGAKLMAAGLSGELGICYLGLGYPNKALQIHLQAEKVLLDHRAQHSYQVNLADIGNVYLHKKEYYMAITYYRRALAIAREIEAPASIAKWSFNLQLAFAKLRKSMD